MTDVRTAQAALAADLSSLGGEDTIFKLFDFTKEYRKASTDAAASTALANEKFFTNPFDYPLQIVSAVLSPDGTIAKAAANYANVAVKTDDGRGGTPQTAMAWSTASGSLATGLSAGIAQAGSGAATACVVPPGGSIYAYQEKNSSGVTLPPYELSVRLRRM